MIRYISYVFKKKKMHKNITLDVETWNTEM